MQNVSERIAEIKDRIKKIDTHLDSDISDELFDSLEAEAITLTEELGRLESLNSIYNAKKLERVNDWTSNFLHSFKVRTQVITNKQAECFKKINGGIPFIFENYHYDCSGPNYEAGFSHLIITKIWWRFDRLFLETGDYIHFLIYSILLYNISLILKYIFKTYLIFLWYNIQ